MSPRDPVIVTDEVIFVLEPWGDVYVAYRIDPLAGKYSVSADMLSVGCCPADAIKAVERRLEASSKHNREYEYAVFDGEEEYFTLETTSRDVAIRQYHDWKSNCIKDAVWRYDERYPGNMTLRCRPLAGWEEV